MPASAKPHPSSAVNTARTTNWWIGLRKSMILRVFSIEWRGGAPDHLHHGKDEKEDYSERQD